MDETVENLVTGLLDTLDELGVPLGGNTRALAILDAQSTDKHIDDLEDKVEELEWNAEDYYQTDKDDIDVVVTKAVRKTFFDKENNFLAIEECDYDQWLDDVIVELKEEMEKVNKNKDV